MWKSFSRPPTSKLRVTAISAIIPLSNATERQEEPFWALSYAAALLSSHSATWYIHLHTIRHDTMGVLDTVRHPSFLPNIAFRLRSDWWGIVHATSCSFTASEIYPNAVKFKFPRSDLASQESAPDDLLYICK